MLGRLADPSKFCFVFYRCDPESARQIEETVLATGKPPFDVKVEFSKGRAPRSRP